MHVSDPRTRVFIRGSVSIAMQEPWIIQGTLKQNITFGQEAQFDEDRYKNSLYYSQIMQDILQFPDGDQTVIGEKGETLSGGQMKRLNLARAIYQDADLYIFDDILASLDIKVATSIFQECLLKYLSGKTIIFISSSLNHLRFCNRIVLLRDGQIEAAGTYDEIKRGDQRKALEDVEKVTR